MRISEEAAASRPALYHYRHRLGNFDVIVVSDGIHQVRITPHDMRNVSFEQYKAALVAAYLSTETLGRHHNPVVVDTGVKLVLIDTGNVHNLIPGTGLLAAGLEAAGIDRKAIDIVLITHLDHDHIGGLRDPEGRAAFPNAEIKVPAGNWNYFTRDEYLPSPVRPEGWPRSLMTEYDMIMLVRQTFATLPNRVVRFEPGEEVVPGITSIATSGHSPGHVSYLVTSQGESLVVAGDVSGNPFTTLRNPGWHPAADVDGPQAEASRRRLFDMIAEKRALVSGYHFPFPSLGNVEKHGDGYRLIPIWWNPVM